MTLILNLSMLKLSKQKKTEKQCLHISPFLSSCFLQAVNGACNYNCFKLSEDQIKAQFGRQCEDGNKPVHS